MTLVDTEKTGLSVSGVPLKTHRVIFRRAEGVAVEEWEGGNFVKRETDTIPKDRIENPELGDWACDIVIKVRVFDEKKWRDGELRLQEISDEQIMQLGPESFTDKLLALKYQFQL